MKRKLFSLSAAAIIAGTAAFAQDTNTLNEGVYAQGMSVLRTDGYSVNFVRQDTAGNVTFMASNDAGGRTLILDDEGNVVSDTRASASAGAMLNMGTDMDEFAANTMVFVDEGQATSDGGYADHDSSTTLPDGGATLDLGGDGEMNTGTEVGAGADRSESLSDK